MRINLVTVVMIIVFWPLILLATLIEKYER